MPQSQTGSVPFYLVVSASLVSRLNLLEVHGCRNPSRRQSNLRRPLFAHVRPDWATERLPTLLVPHSAVDVSVMQRLKTVYPLSLLIAVC